MKSSIPFNQKKGLDINPYFWSFVVMSMVLGSALAVCISFGVLPIGFGLLPTLLLITNATLATAMAVSLNVFSVPLISASIIGLCKFAVSLYHLFAKQAEPVAMTNLNPLSADESLKLSRATATRKQFAKPVRRPSAAPLNIVSSATNSLMDLDDPVDITKSSESSPVSDALSALSKAQVMSSFQRLMTDAMEQRRAGFNISVVGDDAANSFEGSGESAALFEITNLQPKPPLPLYVQAINVGEVIRNTIEKRAIRQNNSATIIGSSFSSDAEWNDDLYEQEALPQPQQSNPSRQPMQPMQPIQPMTDDKSKSSTPSRRPLPPLPIRSAPRQNGQSLVVPGNVRSRIAFFEASNAQAPFNTYHPDLHYRAY